MLFCCLRRNAGAFCHKHFVVISRHQQIRRVSPTFHRHRVDNTWRSQRWQHVMKPNTGRESRFLPTPPAFNAPVVEVPVGILPWRLVRNNWNGVATRWWKIFEDMFIRFDRMYERDRRTDRHRMNSIGHAYAEHCAAKKLNRLTVLTSYI